MSNGVAKHRPPKSGFVWLDNRAVDQAAAIGSNTGRKSTR